MIKVMILEDHEIFREGLKKILAEQSDMKVVGEESNGTEMVRKVIDTEYDILIMDLNLPGRNGLELISEIKKKKPLGHILVLSINSEQESALPSLNAGASGYLCKDAALRDLVVALRKIHDKGRYLSVDLAEKLAFDLLQSDPAADRVLSSIESNIAVQISHGVTVKNIAKGLGLSVSTIFMYRRKILEKLNLHNNIELAHYVLENKLSVY